MATTTTSRCPFISLPSGYQFRAVDGKYSELADEPLPGPNLGPLKFFTGEYTGQGFNAIFRPNSDVNPTNLPNKIIPIGGVASTMDTNNILELNVTQETIAFTQQANMSAVPNRGNGNQGSVALKGVAYFQVVSDALNPKTHKADNPNPEVIHLEPGLWMQIPASTTPKFDGTVTRMGSIPHGTTINASGSASDADKLRDGAPDFTEKALIEAASLMPLSANPGDVKNFRNFSLLASNENAPRIPQDLTEWAVNGTITQAMLDNPLSVLSKVNASKNISNHFSIQVAAAKAETGSTQNPGSGIVSVGFLDGGISGTTSNASVTQFSATFWVNNVQYQLEIKPGKKDEILHITPSQSDDSIPMPTFMVTLPHDITEAMTINVTAYEIQYLQTVDLFFAEVKWPHVSVASLVPKAPIVVDSSAFEPK